MEDFYRNEMLSMKVEHYKNSLPLSPLMRDAFDCFVSYPADGSRRQLKSCIRDVGNMTSLLPLVPIYWACSAACTWRITAGELLVSVHG
jgi:hypothetical protein